MVKPISLSVRDFALACPLKGSIETQSGYGALPVTGQEVHSRYLNLRKKRIPDYQIEVKLEGSFSSGDKQITLKGRLDGLFGQDPIAIEEVKSDFDIRSLQSRLLADCEHPYILQVQTYGYIWYLENGVIPDMSLHLVSIRDFESIVVPVQLHLERFESWLGRRLSAVVVEYQLYLDEKKRREQIAARLTFPFSSMRAGQKEFVESVERVVGAGSQALFQAPTGLGKTMAVLYPTIKKALSRGSQVIYVTPKNSQHQVAKQSVERLQVQDPTLKALTLTAKSKMCLKEEVFCNPDYCQYARDYYGKVVEHQIVDKVAQANNLDHKRFDEYGRKYEVCPFELSLDTINRADVVIGDYNYVFSPRNIMGRFVPRLGFSKELPDLVVDEAHNLPDRIKSYYSAQLSIDELSDLLPAMQKIAPNFSISGRALVQDAIELIRSRNNHKDHEIDLKADDFDKLLERSNLLCRDYLAGSLFVGRNDVMLSLLRQLQQFSDALAREKGEYATIWKKSRGGLVKVICLDATGRLKESYRNLRSTVAFSATLKPFDYFARLLAMEEEKLVVEEFQSPFPAYNRKLLIIPQVSTRYVDREKNYAKIASAIEKIVAQKQGNYLVFFPSFDFQSRLAGLVELSGSELLLQEKDMSVRKIDSYLSRLRQSNNPCTIFAVQGGVFAEGVDYPGDMLIGVIVVGPGLPGYDFERKLLSDFYEKKYGNGFDYAYVYPGMSKVVQSAGRVIRSQHDRGLIVLLDRRFIETSFNQAMPDYWFESSVFELVSNSILADIQDFWSQRQESNSGI